MRSLAEHFATTNEYYAEERCGATTVGGVDMSGIVARREHADRMWTVVQLDSGEQLMLSITPAEIAIVRLYLGLIPRPIAKWGPALGVLMMFEEEVDLTEDPMDMMVQKLLTFRNMRDLQIYLRRREPEARKRLDDLQRELTTP